MNNWRFIFVLPVLLCVCFSLSAQKLQVGANVAGLACLGTLSAEIDYAPFRHWSFGLSGKYNPFTFNEGTADQMQMRQRSLAAGVRWWPWHVYSGWWLAAKAQWQEYNVGGIISDETEEGQKWGGGLTAGYAYMVNKHFNVEFGLGLWGGVKNYTVYACPTCGRRISGGQAAFVLPNDVIISLTYVF